MGRYRFTGDYESSIGTWRNGDEAAFDERTAAWLLRDVPGIIAPVTQSQPPDATPKDRQVKTAKKRQRNDRGGGGAMSTADDKPGKDTDHG